MASIEHQEEAYWESNISMSSSVCKDLSNSPGAWAMSWGAAVTAQIYYAFRHLFLDFVAGQTLTQKIDCFAFQAIRQLAQGKHPTEATLALSMPRFAMIHCHCTSACLCRLPACPGHLYQRLAVDRQVIMNSASPPQDHREPSLHEQHISLCNGWLLLQWHSSATVWCLTINQSANQTVYVWHVRLVNRGGNPLQSIASGMALLRQD